MGEDRVFKLTVRQKAVGILLVCLVFVFICVLCIKKQGQTYEYNFKLEKTELKAAELKDGVLYLQGGGDDYAMATQPFVLPAGEYTINITYMSDTDGSVLVQGNNDCVFNIELPNTFGELSNISDQHMILPMGTDRGKLKFYVPGEGVLTVGNISIASFGHIYRDYYVYIFLAFFSALALIIVICLFNRLNLTYKGWSYVGLLAITLVLINIPFFIKGAYYEIDTQAHMKRIEAISQGLKDSQFPVLIGPNYANEYGELTALQPGLFLYIPALLRLFNVSIPLSYNLYMILVNVATAAVSLLCAQRMFNTIRWGIIASVIYLVEPFRLYIMLGLGAGAGMGTALIFLPLLSLGMHETLNKGGFRWKYMAVGLWGMACSHVLGFTLGVLTMIVYIIVHAKKLLAKGVFISLIKACAAFIVLSVGVLLPFLGYYFTAWNRAELAWNDFYRSPMDLKSEIFNLIAFAVIVISFIVIRRTGHLLKFGKGIFAMGFIFVIMASSFFPWVLFKWIPAADAFFMMLQYPYRFHFMAIPYVAYAGAEAVCSSVDSADKNRRLLPLVILLLLFAGLLINYREYFKVNRLFSDPVSGEINTVMEDYLPEGTLTEWYKNDTGEFSDYDLVQAYSYSKQFTHIDLTYTSAAEGQYMEFPLFYYKGYAAYDREGRSLKVEQGERNRVRVYLEKTDDVEELHLRYEVNRLYRYFFIFSLIAGGIWLIYNLIYLIIRVYRSKRVII